VEICGILQSGKTSVVSNLSVAAITGQEPRDVFLVDADGRFDPLLVMQLLQADDASEDYFETPEVQEILERFHLVGLAG